MRPPGVILAAALLLPACGSGAGQSAPQECAPATGSLPASVSGASLAGEYRVRLVATDGENRGASVSGTLSLAPPAAEYRRSRGPGAAADTTHRYPLVGAAELELAQVNAVAPGGTGSADPAGPGVLVIERVGGSADRPGRIMLRLGSEANRPDLLRFDGGYTVLRLLQADERGFAGTWESGAPLPRSGGHFCATRLE